MFYNLFSTHLKELASQVQSIDSNIRELRWEIAFQQMGALCEAVLLNKFPDKSVSLVATFIIQFPGSLITKDAAKARRLLLGYINIRPKKEEVQFIHRFLYIVLQNCYPESKAPKYDFNFETETAIKNKLETNVDNVAVIVPVKPSQSPRRDSATSPLVEILQRLLVSSADAVANGESGLDQFSAYLHTPRSVDEVLIAALERVSTKRGHLIFLCGNVGDGKSHLLSWLQSERAELMDKFYVVNDASESYDPAITPVENLAENIFPMLTKGRNVLLAINMGILQDFVLKYEADGRYANMIAFVKESKVLVDISNPDGANEQYSLVSFSDYQLFEIEEDAIQSNYFTGLLDKIFANEESNPFFNAFLKHKECCGDVDILVRNFNYWMEPNARKNLVELLAMLFLQERTVFATRKFFDFIARILLPSDYVPGVLPISQHTLSLLFDQEHGYPFNLIHAYDAAALKSVDVDFFLASRYDGILNQMVEMQGSNENKVNHWLRLEMMKNSSVLTSEASEFIRHLHLCFSSREVDEQFDVFNQNTIDVLYQWNGSTGIDNVLFVDENRWEYRIGQEVTIGYDYEKYLKGNIAQKNGDGAINRFKLSFPLFYQTTNTTLRLDVDYLLFQLLLKVKEGYMPNREERTMAMAIDEFVNKLISAANSGKTPAPLWLFNRIINRNERVCVNKLNKVNI